MAVQIKVTVTEEQLSAIKKKSDALGLKPSQYLRLAALTAGDVAGTGKADG